MLRPFMNALWLGEIMSFIFGDSQQHDFADYFGKGMDKDDGAKIQGGLSTIIARYEYYVGLVQEVEVLIAAIPELV